MIEKKGDEKEVWRKMARQEKRKTGLKKKCKIERVRKKKRDIIFLFKKRYLE